MTLDARKPIDPTTLSAAKQALIAQRLRERKLLNSPSDAIPRRGDRAVAPLSPAQQPLWVLEQLAPGRSPYNVPALREIVGPLDIAGLRAAFRAVVERQEALRTAITDRDGAPRQLVRPVDSVAFEVVDLRGDGRSPAERLAHAEARLQSETTAPFDLEAGPLFRASLIALDESRHLLQIVAHHLVFDGASLGIFFAELAAAYDAIRVGAAPGLPDLPIQFGDYARWQRERLTGEALAGSLGYWRERLLAATERVDLRTDRPRIGHDTNGARRRAVFPRHLTDALKRLARAHDATLFMVLLAAFQTLLHRYSAQTDIVVGSPVDVRDRPELVGLIGYLVQTLPLRAQFVPGQPFEAFLDDVRRGMLGAFEHRDVPYEDLLAAATGAAPRASLFSVVFALQGEKAAEPRLGEAALTARPTDNAAAPFELGLSLTEREDGLHAVMQYRTALFDATTIDRLLVHYRTLLESVVAAPATAVDALAFITAAEREQQRGWNATQAPHRTNATIVDLMREQAARTPDALAVSFEADGLTYAQLDERANRLGSYLRARGVGPEVLVAVCVERSLDMVVAVLGVQRAGGAVLPIDASYPRDRIAFMLADAQPLLTVTHEALRELLPPGTSVVSLDGERAAIIAGDPAPPSRGATAGDLAYVIYTSGSTGRPKGVQIEHGNVVNFVAGMQSALHLGPGDTVLATAPLAFDISGLDLYVSLSCGARVVLASAQTAIDPQGLMALMKREQPTLMQGTPPQWRMLLEAGWQGERGLTIVCGGEAVSRPLAERLIRCADVVWHAYGPTEATIIATFERLASDPAAAVPIGRPMANVTAYVLDARGEPLPAGIGGELYLGGAGVGRGYLNRPELTAERFVADPFVSGAARMYRTGDRALFNPDGTITFLGRFDFQVKLRGHRIELGEIETALEGMPTIRSAVAVIREDDLGNAQLCAYYVALPRAPESSAQFEAALRAGLSERLPLYMVPTHFVALETLPLSNNGKVDRSALPRPANSPARRANPDRAPRNAAEAEIVRIFGEVLGCVDVGVDDDFFALGGHSLLALRILAAVTARLDVHVQLRAFFAAPTPAGLAAAAGASSIDHRAQTALIARRTDGGRVPLSQAQRLVWLQEQSVPGTPLYNVPLCYRVSGEVDLAMLRRALDLLIARHEMLGTRFEEHAGEPFQVPGANHEVGLSVVEVRESDPADRRAIVEAHLQTAARTSFDLAHGPLLRATFVSVSGNSSYLLLVAHHIAFDGWSAHILLTELTACYEAVRSAQPAALAPLPIQYADYASWERRVLVPERFAALESFWREQLVDAPAALALPTDRPRGVAGAFEAGRRSIVIPQQIEEAVLELGRQHGCTLFMTMLAAFQTLLHRYGGQAVIVVGSPVAGRADPQTAALIGFFVQMLAFRADFADDPRFVDLLAATRSTSLSVLEHGQVPVEAFAAERPGAPGEPIVRVVLIVEADAPARAVLGAAELTPVDVVRGVSAVDLTLVLRRLQGGLRATMHYRTDLFDAPTIDRILGHFQTLLESVGARPTSRVSRLPLLTASERREALVDWNATAVTWPATTLDRLFEEQAERTPEATAVEDESGALSYAALDRWSQAIAQRLRSRGVGPGVLVGVCAERSVAVVAALLGVLKAGGAYVPLDPEYPAERLAFMLDDSAAPVVLADAAMAATLPVARERFMVLDRTVPGDMSGASEAAGDCGWRATPDDPAYMIYTSGSTGRPKGALNSHRAICNRLRWMQARYRIGPGDAVLQKTPLSFDVSVWELFWPLLAGARLVMAKPGGHRDPGYLIDTIVGRGITTLHFVPSMLREFLSRPDVERCTSVRDVMCSGEVLSADLPPAFFRRLGASLHNLYGPTEAAVDVTHWTVPRDWTATVPIGEPVANTQIYLLDAAGEPVPIGVAGELYIGGVQVGLGYHERPELTAQRFVPDPFGSHPGGRLYRTGDLARRRPDGAIEYLGRTDFQVKVRGQRIELGEIENVMSGHADVRHAYVMLREDTPGNPLLCGYFVPSVVPDGAQSAVTEAALRAYLRAALPGYMVPTHLLALTALPVTANGKIDRRALPVPAAAAARTSALVEPSSAAERVVARIFAEVLAVDATIGVDDNFFELGGHSILAMRAVARSSKLLRAALTLRTFFDRPTVRAVCAALTAAESTPGRVEAVARAVLALHELSGEERQRRRDRLNAAARTANDVEVRS